MANFYRFLLTLTAGKKSLCLPRLIRHICKLRNVPTWRSKLLAYGDLIVPRSRAFWQYDPRVLQRGSGRIHRVRRGASGHVRRCGQVEERP